MILVALSLVLYILSFPPFSIPFLIFIAFVPAFLAIGKISYKKVFWWFFAGGAIFSLIHVYWILNLQVPPGIEKLLVLGLILMIAYLGAFYGIIGVAFKYGAKSTAGFLLFIPSAWVLIEFFRSYGDLGFPWNPLWETLLHNLSIYQIARFWGPFGVSFLIILVNALIAYGILKRRRLFAVIGLLMIVALQFWGIYLRSQTFKSTKSLKVAIFQPNVLPRYEDNPEEWKETFAAYDSLNRLLKDSPDLIVFSESSLPGYYRLSRNSKEVVRNVLERHKSYILLGTADYKFETRDKYNLYNAAFLISPTGAVIDKFYKTHLVPFGEWLPFQDKFPWLAKIHLGQGNYLPGKRFRPLQVKCARLGVLICFESIFPEIARKEVNLGANLLVNITNDGWFGRSLGPREHFYLAIFRSIETQRYLVRAAKTGISAIVSPEGKIEEKLDQFKLGIIEREVPLLRGETFYVRHGNWMVYLSLLMAIIFLAYNSVKRLIHGG